MAKNCNKCQKPAKTDLKHLGPLCGDCFCEVIEKRVRKHMRESALINRNDAVHIEDDGTARFSVAKYLLESISKDLPIKITAQEGKLVIPWSLDQEIEAHLKELFGEEAPVSGHIKLLSNVSDEELALFAEVKGLPGKMPEKTELGRKLSELEQKYPGSKFGLLKSFQNLE